jgi:endogenous inhibitor of DNA gyrase (YacG/DUF329 family)
MPDSAFRLWSALTCQRFGRLRLVAVIVRSVNRGDQSGDESPHSKFGHSWHPAFTFTYFLLTFALMPKCPTCGKPVEWQDNPWRPFCSERCKLIDFSRWANEEYRVPGANTSPAEGDELPTVDKANNEDDVESLGGEH